MYTFKYIFNTIRRYTYCLMLCKLLWTEFHYKHIYLRRSRSSKFRIGLGGQLQRETWRAAESVDSMASAWLVFILEKRPF